MLLAHAGGKPILPEREPIGVDIFLQHDPTLRFREPRPSNSEGGRLDRTGGMEPQAATGGTAGVEATTRDREAPR